jgi:hypothetical protein
MSSGILCYTPAVLLAHSYSPYTIMDIRCCPLESRESNQQRVKRLAHKYALPEVEIKLLMAADDDVLDGYGRMLE